MTLTVVEHDDPGPWPRTTIGPGPRVPRDAAGYELTTLVHGIVEAGRAEAPSLTDATLERLASASSATSTIDVFVTPT